MYEYRCVMTMAQIELLSVDKPVISYGKSGGKDEKFRRPDKDDVRDKAERWRKKYKDGHRPSVNLSKYKTVGQDGKSR